MHASRIALATLIAATAHAAGTPDLTWHSMDGGGGTSTGGGWSLAGTIAQCDAGDVAVGGAFVFEGGFWPGITGGETCPADLDGDGLIGPADLAIVLGGWSTPQADLDGDGTTGSTDLALLLGAWGPCF